MAEGRARALEHRENRDIFMEEIGAKAREWGKQYLLLLQEAFQNLGTGAQLLLTTEYGPQALYGAAGLFAAYYGIRGGVGLGFRCLSPPRPTMTLLHATCAVHWSGLLTGNVVSAMKVGACTCPASAYRSLWHPAAKVARAGA